MSHDSNKEFDGIRQADNPLPGWFVWSFIGTIVFSAIYLPYYHIFTDWSQEGQYAAEVAAHIEEYGDPADDVLEVTDGRNPLRGDVDAIASGGETYRNVCAACHAADGSGLVGPALNDSEWMHGGEEMTIFAIVADGITEASEWRMDPPRGPMPAHRGQLGERRIWEVIAFMDNEWNNVEPGGEL